VKYLVRFTANITVTGEVTVEADDRLGAQITASNRARLDPHSINWSVPDPDRVGDVEVKSVKEK